MNKARVFLLVLLFLMISLALYDLGFAQTIPPGYRFLQSPRVSGGVLIAGRPAQSASALLIQGFQEVVPAFDRRPEALASFQDTHGRQGAGAWFTARIQGAPVCGLALAGVTRGNGIIAFAFDSPATIAATLPRLFDLVGPVGQDPTSGLNWRTSPFPDGSGQIELPDGWQIVFARKGMVAATGPHGEIERGVATPVMSRAGAARLGAMAQQLPMPVLDPTDPVSALTGVWAHLAATAQQVGRPAPRIFRVIEAAPVSVPVPGLSQAAYVHFEYERAGSVHRALSFAIMGSMGPDGQWLFYQTYVSAPTHSFAQNLPILVRIWNSALTARHVVQERLDHALASLREAGDIWQKATRGREDSLQRMHDNWTEALRGTRIIEDTLTRERRNVNLSYSTEIVNQLNRQEPGRYQEIPLWQFNQR